MCFAGVYDQSGFLSTSGLCFPPPALLPVGPFSLRAVADVTLNLGLLDIIGRPVLLCSSEEVGVQDVFFALVNRNIHEHL